MKYLRYLCVWIFWDDLDQQLTSIMVSEPITQKKLLKISKIFCLCRLPLFTLLEIKADEILNI
jgi:hypothetical protein